MDLSRERHTMDESTLTRRSIFLAGGTAALLATQAQGVPLSSGRDGTAAVRPGNQPDTSPITTTIASAPISGYVYRNVCMYDFKPFNPGAGLTWGGNGTYSSG